jgi:hypothetical protein
MLPSLNNLLIVLEKVFAIIGSIIYFIFASIVVRQAKNFSKNVQDIFNPVIITASIVHLITSGILVFLAFSLLLYH